LETPRRRLLREYRRLGSWQAVADRRGVNVAYPYNFVRHGKVPANPRICKALGIRLRKPKPAGGLLDGVQIHDQPEANLRWALEHREAL
jgi:hypothetical protein